MHTIKNQRGKYIIDKKIREEIIHALDHGLSHAYFKNTKIEIISDFKKDGERGTIVNIDI